ncbi:phage tail sheath family protein [Rhodohalobacter sulfatireducens]|uniref:Phage tail sheath subtilisin-like domain-containing protein n=1 Tax=Rhodohalobacter sulfatireducens TaxID=2911366 RepID=A0ABS9KGI3_9BACT|nr:phage tail sheath C-terminal domain-containing protein [Rhodohalobacter sulfatireducens]MCG2589948.1 phage tail sheath subtilisin-like domain-containing protein [Rhodohalobacter sulfatireducens]
MANYKTPGVYVEEISLFPPSVAQVETAIPAFIGYTEEGPTEPTKIKSMVDYRTIFGGPSKELPDFTIDGSGNITADASIPTTPVYKMYYMLEIYFSNGGGPCYILSVGGYQSSPAVTPSELSGALSLLKKEDEPTLILFPDAQSISDPTDYHGLYVDAMIQCANLGDRFTICDVQPADSSSTDPVGDAAQTFRDNIGTNNLMYGAAYYPNLKTSLVHQYNEDELTIDNNGTSMVLRHSDVTLAEDSSKEAESLFHANNGADRSKYYDIRKMIEDVKLILPPSGAVAGAYALVDSNRGVWKSPANVSLNRVSAPTVSMETSEQDGLNVSDTGKSINAIRKFSGKGVLIWGARTLDGNSNEWRYVSVRRFFNMVEESVKKASSRFVFEPNDANTWVKVKAMIENFLTLQWRAGALMGAKAEDAFFVKVGLGETMTQDDVLNGRMIVEIGMAAVRPAEFIILRFSHKMIES